MPALGRKPKPEDQRRNRMPPVHDWIEVEDVPYHGPAPLLPPRYRTIEDDSDAHQIRQKWPARTRNWWAVVSAMPHCVLWTPSDWQDALDCAECHARFVEGANGTELRIRTKRLGITADDRRDLRIRYVPARPEPAEAGEAVPDNVRYLDL